MVPVIREELKMSKIIPAKEVAPMLIKMMEECIAVEMPEASEEERELAKFAILSAWAGAKRK
jgi:hypothetical protein